jgi:hypothetical protein
VTQTDRHKTVWFAGSATGTPIADKVGDAYGGFEVSDGLALDVAVQFTDSALASQIDDDVREMKSRLHQAPGQIREVLENLEVTRRGDRLRVTAKISESQLQTWASEVSRVNGTAGGASCRVVVSIRSVQRPRWCESPTLKRQRR